MCLLFFWLVKAILDSPWRYKPDETHLLANRGIFWNIISESSCLFSGYSSYPTWFAAVMMINMQRQLHHFICLYFLAEKNSKCREQIDLLFVVRKSRTVKYIGIQSRISELNFYCLVINHLSNHLINDQIDYANYIINIFSWLHN